MSHPPLNSLNPDKPFQPEDFVGSREIRFINRRESSYPTLMRLCMDFNLRVVQLQRKIYSHISLRLAPTAPEFFLLGGDHQHPVHPLTSGCASLRELEDYVARHQIDILHDYLFGDDQKIGIG